MGGARLPGVAADPGLDGHQDVCCGSLQVEEDENQL